jgi:hypothetical protein
MYGRHPDVSDTGQDTTEEHRGELTLFGHRSPVASVSTHVAVDTFFQKSDVDRLSNEGILELKKNVSELDSDSNLSVFKLTPCAVARPSQALDEDCCRRLRSERA